MAPSSRRTTSRPAAGLAILRAGGSAVDAAIATNAVLAVVMPNSCGIGGDAFWLIWDAAAGRQLALNGSGRSPAAADAAALRGAGLAGDPVARPACPITVPGAVRSWGDAHARFGRLDRGTRPGAGHRAGRGGLPGLATVHRGGRADGAARSRGARDRMPAFFARASGRTAGRGVPASWSACPRSRRRSRRLATEGSRRSTRATSAIAPGPRPGRRGLADHGDRPPGARALHLERADRDRLSRRPGHDPPAQQLGDRRARAARDPGPVRAAAAVGVRTRRGHRPGLDPPRDRGGQAGDGRPRRAPDRSRASATSRSTGCSTRATRRRSPRRIDPRRAARPGAATNPRGGGTVYLGGRRRRRQCGQPHRVQLLGFGSGVVDPATGILYQNRGSYFSLDPDHPNVLAPGKRTLHTLIPGMLFRDGVAGRGSWPARWAATPSRRSTPSCLGPGRRRASTSRPRSRRRAGSSSRPAFRAAGGGPRWSRASARASLGRSRRWATRSRDRRRSTPLSATSTPSSSSAAVRRRRTGRWRRSTDPRSDGLPAVW